MLGLLLFLQAEDRPIDEQINAELAAMVSLIVFISCVTAAVIVWQLAKTWRARYPAKRDQSYLQLATEAVAAQEATSQALTEVASQLNGLTRQVAELERILRTIE